MKFSIFKITTCFSSSQWHVLLFYYVNWALLFHKAVQWNAVTTYAKDSKFLVLHCVTLCWLLVMGLFVFFRFCGGNTAFILNCNLYSCLWILVTCQMYWSMVTWALQADNTVWGEYRVCSCTVNMCTVTQYHKAADVGVCKVTDDNHWTQRHCDLTF
jgi:hypothetical protein